MTIFEDLLVAGGEHLFTLEKPIRVVLRAVDGEVISGAVRIVAAEGALVGLDATFIQLNASAVVLHPADSDLSEQDVPYPGLARQGYDGQITLVIDRIEGVSSV